MFGGVAATREESSKGARELSIPARVAWSGNAWTEFPVNSRQIPTPSRSISTTSTTAFSAGDYFSGGPQSGSVDTDDAYTEAHAPRYRPTGKNEVTWMRRTFSDANTRLLVSYQQQSGGRRFHLLFGRESGNPGIRKDRLDVFRGDLASRKLYAFVKIKTHVENVTEVTGRGTKVTIGSMCRKGTRFPP